MRSSLQRSHKAISNSCYIALAVLFELMTVNDVLLGLQILNSTQIPLLLASSLILKSLAFMSAIYLVYHHRALIASAKVDTLTGAYRREVFFASLDRLICDQGGDRTIEDTSIILLDLDNFKQVNDTLGHQTGDRVLMQVANTVQSVIRHNDIFARFGGDEFGILLPRTSTEEASKLAHRLRSTISSLYSSLFGVHASFGVGTWDREETGSQLYARVDGLLYQAKRKGKDRVISE